MVKINDAVKGTIDVNGIDESVLEAAQGCLDLSR